MYLTENNLAYYLKSLCKTEWLHNKNFFQYKIRPDYRNDTLKIIVEFDGYRHYSCAKQVIRDNQKGAIYASKGYKIVRIPYFVQMSPDVFSLLFRTPTTLEGSSYKHGFIDKKALLPCDFCELGIKRFQTDLEKFSIVKKDIVESLEVKIAESGDINCVLPPSLFYLVKGSQYEG